MPIMNTIFHMHKNIVPSISGRTRLACLLGHPVAHSMSPAMHNLAAQICHEDLAYLAFDTDADHLPLLLDALKEMNFLGANLTMPLKTAVIPCLDELSLASRLCHSVNTIVNDGGRLIGHSTDGIGYLDSLRDVGFDITGKTMTLLGAGGAARSILVQAALDGIREIRVFKRRNQTFETSRSFLAQVERETGTPIRLLDIADSKALARSIAGSQLLTNATSVGMAEDPRSLVDADLMHPGLFVSDIIYHPLTTPLLARAKERGLAHANGLYMLLFQGAASFKLWTGRDMPVEQIRSLFTEAT